MLALSDMEDILMRKLGGFLVAVLFAGTAHAAAPDAKVDVNCALYAECGATADAPQAGAADPAATTAPSRPRVRTGATRGFSMAGPAVAAPAQATPKPQAKAMPGVPARAKVAMVMRPKTVQAMQTAAVVKAGQLITFRTGSADITPQGTQIAQQLAAAMLRADKLGQRFSVQGHTDAVGSRELNLALSQRRAASLAAYLVSQGVTPSRLDTVGFGFDRPLPGARGTSPDNRRVEVKPVS